MRRPALALALLMAASAPAAHAVTLHPGDIIVAGRNEGGATPGPTPLLLIDGATGDRTVVSGCAGDPCTAILGTGGEVRVIRGIQEGVTALYRLTVGDAIEFQRRMIAARKANRFGTWISFARVHRPRGVPTS